MVSVALLWEARFVGATVSLRAYKSERVQPLPSTTHPHTGELLQAPNDEPRQLGLSAAAATGSIAAACEDPIRAEQQRHQQELAVLRVHYETKLRAVSEQLGALQRECGPCADGHDVSSVNQGIALV
jgi:hypothetical protein